MNRVWHTKSSRNSYDWRYRYSASGEREQKRLVRFVPWIPPVVTHPIDTLRIAGGWVYYLLGASNEQLAVYHGQQDTGNVCNDTAAGVSMYPTEYLTYGVGHNASVMTRPDGVKEYRVGDHLGSVRAVAGGSSVQGVDYEPFGALLSSGEVTPGLRKGYIDREVDKETELGNYGVRQYDPSIGRSLSVDALAAQYPSLSPYHYSANNPLVYRDPSGLAIDVSDLVIQDEGNNTNNLQKIIDDLESKTGLKLRYSDNGLLVYDPSNTNENMGSEVLRKILKNAMDSREVIDVKLGATCQAALGGRWVELNFQEIEDGIKGSVGVDNTTYGYAFSFMHEIMHTVVGPNGGLDDDKSKPQGEVEIVLNMARRELGSSYGQRYSYKPMFPGGLGLPKWVYIPFSNDSYKDLRDGHAPGGKYVMLPR